MRRMEQPRPATPRLAFPQRRPAPGCHLMSIMMSRMLSLTTVSASRRRRGTCSCLHHATRPIDEARK
jgi:hypothetical protein